MKNTFTIRAVFFVLPLALLLAAVEMRLSGNSGNIYGDKAERLRHQTEVNALVLGSSHAMFGVDPAALDLPSFNLAFPYETPEMTLSLAEKFVPLLPRLKVIYCGLSYFSLRARLDETPGQNWRLFSYGRVLGAPLQEAPWEWLDLRNYSLYFALTPAVAKALLRGKDVPREWDGIRDDGFIPIPDRGSSMRTERVAESRLEFYDRWMRPENRDTNVRALRRLAELAASRGVRLVFFTPPVMSVFVKRSNPAVLAERKVFARALADATPEKVRYLDYFEEGSLAEDLYFDPDHLNAKGAVAFSRRLRQDGG